MSKARKSSKAKRLKVHIDWHCPQCGHTAQTAEMKPHVRMHRCPKLHGLDIPLVRDDMDAKVVAVEREDYLRDEVQTTDDRGKPITAIRVERADGTNDTYVNAPLAKIGIRSNG